MPVTKLTLRINFGLAGWSESYWLRDAIDSVQVARSLDLLKRRMLWLGQGPYLEYACLTHSGRPKDSTMLDTAGFNACPPNLPEAAMPPNDWGVGPEYAFIAPTGRKAYHIFRGIPDGWIAGMLATPPLAFTPLGRTLTTMPPLVYSAGVHSGTSLYDFLGGGGLTTNDYRRSFLDAVQLYTGFPYKGTVSAPLTPDAWTIPEPNNVFATGLVVFRQVAGHRTGKLFGQSRGRAAKRY